ncbi:hypothetical protein DU002_00765 [Corallincola holothuriorum]|uniref:DUF4153 domain-containing protein n=1 Tax=Corallincola holothuriorum TaxID=2282215 RepID=A0A368NS76_9GAMM|nr:hypothetical protein [Corallincola holothuriorum]RCU52534.1 hypothetical protein DU002_00765 [Corallincola holothuriorum]
MKLPNFTSINEEWFYSRFTALITFAAIAGYFFTLAKQRNELSAITRNVLIGFGCCTLFLWLLPDNSHSASITMSLIHMPLLLISLLALAFMNRAWRSSPARLLFIRYLGELAIYTVLILIGGMILTAVTFALFQLIELSIESWYLEYVVVFGMVASPVVGTYLYDYVLNRESKLASILSNVFSPLFFITISGYLLATLLQGKSPFSDRDFLIVFNGLLLVIWGLTVFSISGMATSMRSHLSDWMNVCLVSVTLVVNSIALSAILFRWAEYGLTVNRIVVTGANLLIFIHLILILVSYVQYIRHKNTTEQLEQTVATYLPAYSLWSIFVVTLLPLLFSFA